LIATAEWIVTKRHFALEIILATCWVGCWCLLTHHRHWQKSLNVFNWNWIESQQIGQSSFLEMKWPENTRKENKNRWNVKIFSTLYSHCLSLVRYWSIL
jgi:hypothetical protein